MPVAQHLFGLGHLLFVIHFHGKLFLQCFHPRGVASISCIQNEDYRLTGPRVHGGCEGAKWSNSRDPLRNAGAELTIS